ncbi:MAG TPA: hypothetical protein VJK05_01640 [archaeon]|nr:hypothetical protein [archaeon]
MHKDFVVMCIHCGWNGKHKGKKFPCPECSKEINAEEAWDWHHKMSNDINNVKDDYKWY